MPNGIVTQDLEGSVMIGFQNIVEMRKMKTEGTAHFKEEDLGKDAVRIILNDWHNRSLWILEPHEIDRVWNAYQSWVISAI